MSSLRRTLRGNNATLNIFEVWLALGGIIGAIVFFYKPASIDNGALAKTIGYHLALAWTCGFFAAAAAILYGLLRPSPRWEVVGLFLYGSAAVASGLSILNIFGFRGVATTMIYLSLSAASWTRAALVWAAVERLAGERQNGSC